MFLTDDIKLCGDNQSSYFSVYNVYSQPLSPHFYFSVNERIESPREEASCARLRNEQRRRGQNGRFEHLEKLISSGRRSPAADGTTKLSEAPQTIHTPPKPFHCRLVQYAWSARMDYNNKQQVKYSGTDMGVRVCLVRHWIGKEPPSPLLCRQCIVLVAWALILAIERLLIPPYARRGT